MSWGIFTVATDVDNRFVYSPRVWLSYFKALQDPCYYFLRFVIDLWRIAPRQSLEYYAHNTWMVMSPVLSSYVGYLVLHRVSPNFR